jgi:lactate dehydrogenase-like 2-hydroxyacid dehydrogenase
MPQEGEQVGRRRHRRVIAAQRRLEAVRLGLRAAGNGGGAAALVGARRPPPQPHPAEAAATELPLVGVIDMENKDGTIYDGTGGGDGANSERLIEREELEGVARVVYTGAASIEEVDPALLKQLSAVLLRRCPLGAAQLAAMPSLRAVVRMGAGYDNVDTGACTAAGVVACNCPDAWVEEVADSTLCLTIALIRRVFELTRLVSAGRGWTRQADLQQKRISRLRGMRLGIVGLGRCSTRLAAAGVIPHASRRPARTRPVLTGISMCRTCGLEPTLRAAGTNAHARIGTAVLQRARAFGFELAFYDPHLPPGVEKVTPGVSVSLCGCVD